LILSVLPSSHFISDDKHKILQSKLFDLKFIQGKQEIQLIHNFSYVRLLVTYTKNFKDLKQNIWTKINENAFFCLTNCRKKYIDLFWSLKHSMQSFLNYLFFTKILLKGFQKWISSDGCCFVLFRTIIKIKERGFVGVRGVRLTITLLVK
jgi:hypothetical protein